MGVGDDFLLTPYSWLGEIKTVNRIINHSSYNSSTMRNDIALLELSSPISLSSSKAVVSLPDYDQGDTWPLAGTSGKISGFGDIAVVTHDPWETGTWRSSYRWYRNPPFTSVEQIPHWVQTPLYPYDSGEFLRLGPQDHSSGSMTSIWVEVTLYKTGYKPVVLRSSAKYPY